MKKLVISGLLSCSLLLGGLVSGQKTEAASVGDTVTDIALEYIGVPYVWGGSSPSGFDCSGFTSYTYKQAGITLPRTAADQYTKGQAVAKGNLTKGDLVFFSTYKAGASHVGISLGGEKFVHASSNGVKISSLSESYYNQTYIGSKRIGNYNNGWVLSGGKWYYYKNSVKATGWIKDNSRWYYLTEADGSMKTGWLFVDDNWYYLNGSGAMLSGWISTGGKWYFLYNNGSMAKNTTIGGYAVDSNGAWIQ
ncbi:NlpC/P60 family protein [Neobacillus sp. NPDC058068]|uniref:C40 family peptidase n=1 Tax=Neobacillus sp. NPDC058068 TaxID=3346325 RepID=UPI0036DD0262